ncbi:MAG: hypothetical protein IKT35_00800, partial [Clostridia bacterium]|nr:hypothetical protein [Clostridia bacterium]
AVSTIVLLCCQEILTYKLVFSLIPSLLFLAIGVSILVRDVIGTKTDRMIRNLNKEKPFTKYNASFSSQSVDFDGKEFKGVSLSATFGDIKCNTQNAFLNGNAVVNARATCGGVTVILPANVNVRVKSTTIFGSVINRRNCKDIEGAPTVYIKSNCYLGTITII